jgi:hypothetical protein
MTGSRRLAACLTTAGLAMCAAPAHAVVVPQKGMKGVELEMTPAQVREVLGGPDRAAFVRHEIMGRVRVWRYGLTRLTFNGTSADAQVIALDTTSRKERFAGGVGVGSTRSTVKRRLRGVRCLVEFTYDHCFLGAFRPGRRVTDLAMDRRGRVARITVGIVID